MGRSSWILKLLARNFFVVFIKIEKDEKYCIFISCSAFVFFLF